jgi:hypothetical protein
MSRSLNKAAVLQKVETTQELDTLTPEQNVQPSTHRCRHQGQQPIVDVSLPSAAHHPDNSLVLPNGVYAKTLCKPHCVGT